MHKKQQNRDSQPIRFRVQNTGDQDVQRTHWVWQKHKGRNGDSQRVRCRVQNTGDQDVQRTHWVWQQDKKKTQEEMKVTLREIKKNLQRTTVEGMKSGFKSTIWNIRKK